MRHVLMRAGGWILAALAVVALVSGGLVLAFTPALLVVAAVALTVRNKGHTQKQARLARPANGLVLKIYAIVAAIDTFVYDISAAIRGPSATRRRPRLAGTHIAIASAPMRV